MKHVCRLCLLVTILAASSLTGRAAGQFDGVSSGVVGDSDSAREASSAPGEAEATAGCEPLSKRLRTTTVKVNDASVDDEYTPTVIAPRSDGTSLLAWTDAQLGAIKVANLGTNDTLESYLPNVDGLQVHAMLTDTHGAVLAVVANDPAIYSSLYCYSSATPKNPVCGKMDVVGIDSNGAERFRTTLTNADNVNRAGALFIWWYAHTARLATDGARYGVYFRDAMSTPRPGVPGQVDIHAGDTLKFVGLNGQLEPGGWNWGCSHSWAVRLAYNGLWGAACHGDAYPDAMQVARLDSSASVPRDLRWLSSTAPTGRALGGLVPVKGKGFWMDYIQTNPANGELELRLGLFPDSGGTIAPDVTIAGATNLNASYPFRPYLAALGRNELLLGWLSGGKLVLAVASAQTGALLEGPLTTNAPVGTFEEFVSTPTGDVVWAHSRGGSSIAVNRVAACRLP